MLSNVYKISKHRNTKGNVFGWFFFSRTRLWMAFLEKITYTRERERERRRDCGLDLISNGEKRCKLELKFLCNSGYRKAINPYKFLLQSYCSEGCY